MRAILARLVGFLLWLALLPGILLRKKASLTPMADYLMTIGLGLLLLAFWLSLLAISYEYFLNL